MRSRYTVRWRCVKCKGYVDPEGNYGVCPCCGHESEDKTTVFCFREIGQFVRIGIFSKPIWVPKEKIGDFEFPTGVTP